MTTDPHAERETRIAQVLEEAQAEVLQGGQFDLAGWQARHPDLADELPGLLETVRDLDTAVEEWRWLATATQTLQPSPPPIAPGATVQLERIGRYRILGTIGAGGMGTVFRGEDPDLQRIVAIKVPHLAAWPGPRGASPEGTRMVQRFLREARAAARVHHPHICPIYDVGEQDGFPYVVMAFVEGPSLAERLQAGRIDDGVAVRIAREIAEALAAIHAQGIVHRDLKPGNILLDRRTGSLPVQAPGQAGSLSYDYVAVLTDFGLARPEDDPQHLTRDGALVGTPAYMSPEQAGGEADRMGPWSDVYSLGVVLYEMLTGRLPFDGPPLAVLSRIRTDAPPPPSRWRPDLDPALEAIVSKAMARRPEARYARASDFAAALAGFLERGQLPPTLPLPVAPEKAQGKPAVVRVELPDGSPVTVSVDAGEAASKMAVSVRERGRGKKGRRLAVTVVLTFTALLFVSLLTLHQPFHLSSFTLRDTEARMASSQALEKAMAARAQAFTHLGNDSLARGKAEEAVKHYRTAIRLNPKQATALNNLGNVLQDRGRADEAIREYRRAITLHPRFALAHYNLGNALRGKGQEEEAIACYRKAITLHPRLTLAHTNLGLALTAQGRAEDAIRQLRLAIQLDPRSARAHNNLGLALHGKGKVDEAIQHFRQAIQLDPRDAIADYNLHVALWNQTQVTNPNPYGATGYSLGYSDPGSNPYTSRWPLMDRAAYGKALTYYHQALELDQKRYPADRYSHGHPDLARSLNNLGSLLKEQKDYDRALPYYQQALAMIQKLYPRDRYPRGHPLVAQSLSNLAELYRAKGDRARARALFEQAGTIRKELLGEKHPLYAASLQDLARVYQDMGDLTRARPLLEQAQQVLKASLGEKHPAYAATLLDLARLYQASKKDAIARPLFEQAQAILKTPSKEKRPGITARVSFIGEAEATVPASGKEQSTLGD
jgi:serine/threonine protein kinase/Flp pilus assembly protein TadD